MKRPQPILHELSEKEIQKQICDYLDLCGYFYAITDAGENKGKSKIRNGWPDITIVLKGVGRVCAVECKTESGELRDDQVEVLQRFKDLGAIVVEARCVEDVVIALGQKVYS